MADKEQNIVDHLDELRKRLIISAIAFFTFFIVGFIYVEDIYQWFVRDLDTKLIILGPSDIVWVYFSLASIVAIAGTIPVLALQIWLFIKPGLTKKEQKLSLSYIPGLFLLFIGGLAFGYFIIFPIIMEFLVNLGSQMMEPSFTAEKYFRFIMSVTLPFGVLFELPVIVMFLTSLGIINPTWLKKIRKYAYFVLFIIAAAITPPDLITEILVAIPLIVLYEISTSLSGFVYKRKLKKDQAWEEASEYEPIDEN
jgi:sec-independent protein translocase protein TatC